MKYLFTLFLCIQFFTTQAQQYTIKKLGLEKKLSNNYIIDIAEDKKAYFALFNNNHVIGMLEFSEKLHDKLLEFLNLSSFCISLKIENIILSERMQKNIDFHDSMKTLQK